MKKKLFILLLTGTLAIASCGCTVSEDTDTTDTNTTMTSEEESTAVSADASDDTDTSNEEEPEVIEVTISAVGDCALGKLQIHGYSGSLLEYYDTYGEDYFFDGVSDIFEEDDFTIANLECVLTTSENRVEKTYNIKGYPEYVGILTAGSIEGVSLANNHTSDYGEESFTDTVNALESAGVTYAYNDTLGYYTTEDGITIGFVSVMMIGESQERLNTMLSGIEQLKSEGVDIILACVHWGVEHTSETTDFQESAGRAMIDAGADVVIGSHPHVLQGMEYYNGGIICYSLGNFCFGANLNPDDKDTVIYQQTFTFVDGEKQTEIDAKIIPVSLSSSDSYNDYQPTVQTGSEAARIIDKMNTYSESYSSLYFDGNGKIYY